MRSIGILGGMGPEATVLLMQKVLRAVPASDDADHIPLIVHQNPQVPSRIATLIDGTGADPAPILAQMAQDLRAAGALALAMPCNTAHHYAGAINAATDLRLLNMLDLTAQHLARKGAKSVGFLASPAVKKTGVFDAAFARHGLRAQFPIDDSAVFGLIKAVKSGEKLAPDALVSPARSLLSQGVDHILIACTELSLYTDGLGDDIPWTDSLDCLIDAIVATAKAP